MQLMRQHSNIFMITYSHQMELICILKHKVIETKEEIDECAINRLSLEETIGCNDP